MKTYIDIPITCEQYNNKVREMDDRQSEEYIASLSHSQCTLDYWIKNIGLSTDAELYLVRYHPDLGTVADIAESTKHPQVLVEAYKRASRISPDEFDENRYRLYGRLWESKGHLLPAGFVKAMYEGRIGSYHSLEPHYSKLGDDISPCYNDPWDLLPSPEKEGGKLRVVEHIGYDICANVYTHTSNEVVFALSIERKDRWGYSEIYFSETYRHHVNRCHPSRAESPSEQYIAHLLLEYILERYDLPEDARREIERYSAKNRAEYEKCIPFRNAIENMDRSYLDGDRIMSIHHRKWRFFPYLETASGYVYDLGMPGIGGIYIDVSTGEMAMSFQRSILLDKSMYHPSFYPVLRGIGKAAYVSEHNFRWQSEDRLKKLMQENCDVPMSLWG